jgi:hypothetical protein
MTAPPSRGEDAAPTAHDAELRDLYQTVAQANIILQVDAS